MVVSFAVTACGATVPQGDELVALCDSLRRASRLSPVPLSPPGVATVASIGSDHDLAAKALRDAEDRAPTALRGPLGRRAAWHERVVEQAAVAATPEALQQQLGSDGVIYFTGASETESDYDAIRHFVQDHC
jgi:hypothetical protein